MIWQSEYQNSVLFQTFSNSNLIIIIMSQISPDPQAAQQSPQSPSQQSQNIKPNTHCNIECSCSVINSGRHAPQCKHRQQQQYLLKIIKQQVQNYCRKLCGYGYSQQEFYTNMQARLRSVFGKNNHVSCSKKLGQIQKDISSNAGNQFVKMIGEYISKKKKNAIKILTQIVGIIDQQIYELESSQAFEEDKVFEIRRKVSKKSTQTLKLQGKRSQYNEAVDQTQKTDLQINTMKNASQSSKNVPSINGASVEGYVKLEHVDQIQAEQCQPVQIIQASPNRKTRGRPAGRKKRNTRS